MSGSFLQLVRPTEQSLSLGNLDTTLVSKKIVGDVC